MPHLVLASSSPRRALLLSSAGYSFAQVAPDVDETPRPDESPEQAVLRLARAKAIAVADAEAFALGADTAVVIDGDAIGKPADGADALAMLRRLSGRTHVVVTGWALAHDGDIVEDGFETTLITLRDITGEEAAAYVDTGEPLDKAGAYALQGDGKRFVTAVAGPRSNVIGLPLQAVVPALKRAGFGGPG